MESMDSRQSSLNEAWRIAVKRIAPDHAVDANELLRKFPNLFPRDAVEQQDTEGFTNEMTVAERKVCKSALKAVAEKIWQNILDCAHRQKPDINN